MKLNKLIVAVFAFILVFPTFTTYADEQLTNFVKYENDLYYIGYDIPADSYILIQKDKSKPSFVGVYTNNSGPKASFKKKTNYHTVPKMIIYTPTSLKDIKSL